ncbi:MAG: glycoside hydrolase, partial [Chloroflexi bacterium]|nr:glycoside hydrolase [Chloroflexota bacterium]
ATWGPIRHVADGARPAAGSAIATTKSPDQRYLHATWRRDAGMVQFSRSSDGGATWSTPIVINDSAMVFGEPRVAASGNDVWVAWARSYVDPDTGTPGKAIVVRHNGRHGRASAWGEKIELTSRSGDVRAPSIAVSGSSIYVTFSDLRTDSTRVMYSHDGGSIWSSTTVGVGFEEDFEGVPTTLPVIAVAGDNVVVAWLAAGGMATARVSTDGGDHWSDEEVLGEGLASAAARVGRLAVAGTGSEGPWLRIWNDGTWGDATAIPEVMLGFEVASAADVDVVLQSDRRVGIVYSAQVDVDEETADTWEEITWFTSPDDGMSWSEPVRVSRPGSETEAFNADRPTAVWLKSGRLWIAWDQEKFSNPGHRFLALRERS